MPGGCPGRQEVCSHRVRDRLKEILNRYHRQRLLDISVRDEVERDIDGAGPLRFQAYGPPSLARSRSELRWPAGWPTENRTPTGWRQLPGATVLRGPGCYAYQADGLSFSRVIVFQAALPPVSRYGLSITLPVGWREEEWVQHPAFELRRTIMFHQEPLDEAGGYSRLPRACCGLPGAFRCLQKSSRAAKP